MSRAASSPGHEFSGNRAGQPEAAAYSIWKMIVLANGSEDWTKVCALYDEYLENYADSVFRLDITARQMLRSQTRPLPAIADDDS